MTDKERIAKLEKEVSDLKEKQIHAKDILDIMKLIGEAKKEYVPYPVYPQPAPWPYQPYTVRWSTSSETTATIANTNLGYFATKLLDTTGGKEVHIYGKREICLG